jgi:hypothetical protein
MNELIATAIERVVLPELLHGVGVGVRVADAGQFFGLPSTQPPA